MILVLTCGGTIKEFTQEMASLVLLFSVVCSASALGLNSDLLLYNRIPKSGSEYMLFVLSKLGKERNNNFTMHGGGTVTDIGISLTDQVSRQRYRTYEL